MMQLPSGVSLEQGETITYIEVDTDAAYCRVSLFGGQVISFVPKHDQRERLWLSPHAFLNAERPIRGGIPVCWPWFSNAHGQQRDDLPAHGFLRSQHWKLANAEAQNESIELTLLPASTKGPGFDFDCEVALKISVGKSLRVSLETINTGKQAFALNGALHTYFEVAHIQGVEINGLTGEYLDKLSDWAKLTTPVPYSITGETDRIHLAKPSQLTLESNDGSDVTTIGSEGHDSIVVWNPWHGAASIADMDAFGFKHFLCVETALTQAFKLAPGETHKLVQIVS